MTWMAATQSARDPPTGESFKPSPVHGQGLPAGGSVEDHVGRVIGHQVATLGRGSRGGVRGVEQLAARRSRGGPATAGSEGAQPPASLRRGLTECGHKEYAGLSPLTSVKPALGRLRNDSPGTARKAP